MSDRKLKEIEWAISELEQSESSFSNYAKLANLYIVRDHMTGQAVEMPVPEMPAMAYSEAAAPGGEVLDQYGDSEFLQAVAGKAPKDVWAVMDELMDTLLAVNTRSYESVMRKLSML